MPEILSANELKVARDPSGGVKIGIGGNVGLLSPDQAIEFARVVLKLVGVELRFDQQMKPPVLPGDFLAN